MDPSLNPKHMKLFLTVNTELLGFSCLCKKISFCCQLRVLIKLSAFRFAPGVRTFKNNPFLLPQTQSNGGGF